MKKRVGILTSGGDCPGLNATIRGVAKACYEMLGTDNVEIIGIADGYYGLIHNMCRVMSPDDFSGILTRGGTILGTKRQPFKMMKVIGEEGTSAEDYILYQKGELLDAVYLQQNSFDPIDAACDPDRQIHEFNVLYDVLTRDFALSDKKEIRAFFNQVRQEFLDWHNTVFRTPEFEAQEKRLKDFYLSKAAG